MLPTDHLCTFVYVLMTVALSFGQSPNKCSLAPLPDAKSKQQCGHRGYTIRCNGTDLNTVPDKYPDDNATFPACLLDLSHNQIHHLWNNSFVNKINLNASNILWLYLQYNNLSYIESGAFVGLENLVYLNLSSNNLVWRKSFGPGLFKPLVSLLNLNMKSNIFDHFNGLDEELAPLERLGGLYVNPTAGNTEFGPKFELLKNLRNLSLSGTPERKCVINKLHNLTFQHLNQINHLFMVGCNISVIQANALKPLTNMTELDISYNENLKFSGMNVALYGLRNTSKLYKLRVNRLHERFERGITVRAKDLENLSTLKGLKYLHMDLNKIEVFEKEVFNQSLLPDSLTHLTVSGNRMTFGDFVYYIYLAKSLTKIDLSRQYLTYDPYFHHDDEIDSPGSVERYFEGLNNIYGGKPDNRQWDFVRVNKNKLHDERSHSASNPRSDQTYLNTIHDETLTFNHLYDNSTSKPLCLPPNLQRLNYSKSFLYLDIKFTFVCNAGNITEVDLSTNFIYNLTGPVFGIGNLKRLDLSQNMCASISSYFFMTFPKLEWLDISSNNLWHSFDPIENKNIDQLFSKQINLSFLDMSNNWIYTLPKEMFKHNTNLKTLNLSRNYMETWRVRLTSDQFEYLDLTENKFHTLPMFLREFLDDRVEHHNVTLLIGYNKIDCSKCESVPFLNWLVTTRVDIGFKQSDLCDGINGPEPMTSRDDVARVVAILKESPTCKKLAEWELISIGVGCTILGCFLTFLIGTTIYKNRWKLRYIYYTRQRRYIHEGLERIFSFDAYVSYAKSKGPFIYETVVPKLEKEQGLKLWVTDRDSAPGISIAENIVYAICNSRKTIFLVNGDFINESWCDYDMNMALLESVKTKRNNIIFILIDSTPLSKLPDHILHSLVEKPSVEYPENESDLDGFWLNLANLLNE